MTKEEVKTNATIIAVHTFLSSFDGSALEVYDRLVEDQNKSLDEIDYALIWQPFENYELVDVLEYIDNLISDIVASFS